MPSITLNVKSEIKTQETISVQDIREKFLFGVQLQSRGGDMPDSTFDFYIQFAQEQIEKYLNVKLNLQIISENKDFFLSDWANWSQVRASYPITTPITLNGFIGTVKQVEYPRQWLSVRKTSDDVLYSRLIHVVPNSYSTYHQSAAVYSGFFPNMGWFGGGKQTPNYWTLEYVTGFKKIPADIATAIGMLAAINILAVANETLAAAMGALGTSSRSISLDGLSQSTSMYINGQTGIFGARIKQYTDTLMGPNGAGGGLLDKLRDYYGTIVWTTM